MEIDHAFLVMFAKSGGLFYFIALSIIVLIYALRPSSKARFDRAAKSIIDDEDRPCR